MKKIKSPYLTFEDSLVSLKNAKRKSITVKILLTTLSGNGKMFLLILFSLGFAQIPGLAIFFGIFIAYLGIRIVLGNHFICLPKFILKKKIPPFFFGIIPIFLKLLKFMRHFSCPRYQWATRLKSTRIINGIMIFIVGLSMAISPPVPLTGWIACLAIFFLAIGLLNDDGAYVIFGIGTSIFYLLTVIFMLHFYSVSQMSEWINCLKERLF